MNRRSFIRFFFVLSGFLVFGLFPSGASAVEQIDEFLVDVEVDENSDLQVTERILYDFGSDQRHGIFRNIPQVYGESEGWMSAEVTVESVTDEDGALYEYELSGDAYNEIKIGDPDSTITGRHWYVITYSVDRVITGFSQYDELYWNATGTEWEVPINKAEVRVTIPEGSVQENNRATCYTGYAQSDAQDCTAEVTSSREYVFETSDLDSYEGITVVAGFDKGVVRDESLRKIAKVEEFYSYATANEDGSVSMEEWALYEFGNDAETFFSHEILPSYGDLTVLDDDQILSKAASTRFAKDISVTDEDGNSVEFIEDLHEDGHSVVIGDGELMTGKKWFVFSYTILNAFVADGDTTEFSWNVTGDTWGVPVNYVEAVLWLPDGDVGSREASCSVEDDFDTAVATCEAAVQEDGHIIFHAWGLETGDRLPTISTFEEGLVDEAALLTLKTDPKTTSILSAERAEITIDGEETFGLSGQRFHLSPGEHEVRVDLPRYKREQQTVSLLSGEEGLIEFKLRKKLFWIFVEQILPFILFFIGLAVIVLIWRVYGKDPEGRGTVVAQYEPPKGMSPGELGVVVDQRAHLHDITSTIIQLAVKGYLKIRKDSEKKKDFTFIRLDKVDRAAGLEEFEKTIFNAIFDKDDTKEKKLKDLKNKFYVHLPAIMDQMYDLVTKEHKLFRFRPNKARKISVMVGVILMGFIEFFALVLAGVVASPWYMVLLLLGPIVFVFSFFMPRRTKEGVLALEHVQGLKLFLTVAEKERLKFHYSPQQFKDLFETLLPYAIALEVEEEWAKAFEDIYEGSPDWYEGQGTFNSVTFMRSIAVMNTSAVKAIASAPSSSTSGWSGGSSAWSGGSGFSGGSSGGGFGGGGGGSW